MPGEPRSERLKGVTAGARTALERLLRESSISALSVEQILAEAGISRATFYAYFDDKGSMLAACAEEIVDEALAASRAWWALPDRAGHPELRDAVSALLGHFCKHRLIVRAVAETAAYDEHARALYERMLTSVEEGIATHIRAGQHAGSVRPDIEPDATAAWLALLIRSGVYQLITTAGASGLKRHIDALTALLWNVLYRCARDPRLQDRS